MSSWSYLARFEALDGQIYIASLENPQWSSSCLTGYQSLEALEIGQGGQVVHFKKFMAPTPVPDNEIICIGTNYRAHAQEAGLPVPLDPVMWYKPKSSLTGPGEILVPPSIQGQFLDFEGELTIVTSKECKDVSEAEAPCYILGYTIGNDLSARVYQDPNRAGGQFTRAKAFDMFAPVGAVIASPTAFGRLDGKRIRTTVNGKEYQNSELDLIHGPAKLISFLSKGTTLPAGTLIMTGSPAGTGYFQDPKVQLQDKDVVEVQITGLGKLTNVIKYT